jgi:hypothetical protein
MAEYTLLEEELEKQYEVYVRRFRNVDYLEQELDRLRVAEHAKQARAERRLRRMQQQVQAEEERRLGRGGKKAGGQSVGKGGGGVFAKVRFWGGFIFARRRRRSPHFVLFISVHIGLRLPLRQQQQQGHQQQHWDSKKHGHVRKMEKGRIAGSVCP